MKKVLNIIFLIIVSLASVNNSFAQQKYRLAVEYYNSGEYEKASEIYASLYKENPQNKSYFNWYIQCLLDLKDYDDAGKIIQS